MEDGRQQGQTMKASSPVRSVGVSQDGQWIVFGDHNNNAILWNAAATQAKVRKFTEHSCRVNWVDTSSDGTKLATADFFRARIFSIPYGDRLLPLSHSNVAGVKFFPGGTRFATASTAQGFRVYSTDNILFDSGQSGCASGYFVTPLVWPPDGQQLLVANKGKIICFGLSKSLTSEWSIHENQSQPSIASNSRFIACAAHSSVSLWDCASHKQISSIITHTTVVGRAAVSPSGWYLACGNGKNITIHGQYLDYSVSVHPLMKLASLTITMLFLCPA
ncbi:hypothetical protein M404DRAFT_738728 [Pisolithus tinctorius Marx 270]|uniref:Anaphase-promoting complex subunit 4 WD40 domain-containing protein n=1 Tax=Pisolithus tinctorius Marx 270 TaxID=870435 RepID=A0A0C3P0X4_PISTI|nr:hypothetical protein M404DRAFT_738728 [Pisolithus tinctorius Marx 270]